MIFYSCNNNVFSGIAGKVEIQGATGEKSKKQTARLACGFDFCFSTCLLPFKIKMARETGLDAELKAPASLSITAKLEAQGNHPQKGTPLAFSYARGNRGKIKKTNRKTCLRV